LKILEYNYKTLIWDFRDCFETWGFGNEKLFDYIDVKYVKGKNSLYVDNKGLLYDQNSSYRSLNIFDLATNLNYKIEPIETFNFESFSEIFKRQV